MYTRVVKGRNKDGSVRAYLQLVQGYRKNGKVHQELICSLGRLDVLQASGGLDRLIGSLAEHSERAWVEAEAGIMPWDKVYGPALVFRRVWEELGPARLLAELQTGTEVQFSLDEAAFAMAYPGCWTRGASGPLTSGWRRSTGPSSSLWSCSICIGPWTTW